MSYRDFPSKLHSEFAYQFSWPQYSLYPTHSVVYILSKSDSWKILSLLELSANFCRVLSVFFRYTVCTHGSTVEAYTAFIIRSCDYILSKAGLFSTKLSLTIPGTWLYILQDVMNQHYTKSVLLIIASFVTTWLSSVQVWKGYFVTLYFLAAGWVMD